MANVAYLLGSNKTLFLKENTINAHAHVMASENYEMVMGLAKSNPNNNYYIIGLCSDYKRMKEEEKANLPKNIHFIVEDEFKVKGSDIDNAEKIYEKLNALVDKLKEIKIDYGIMSASLTTTHLPNLIYKKKTDEFGKLMIFQKRSAMYSNYVINQMDFPYIVWNVDDRFLKCTSSTVSRLENANIGFEPCIYTNKVLKDFSLKSQREGIYDEKEIPVIYNGIDAFMLNTLNFKSFNRESLKLEDNNGMLLFVNPSPDYDRYKDIKEYVLDDFAKGVDVEIHGDWYDKKPETKDDIRFKGKKKQCETIDRLKTAKYSLILASHFKNKKTPCSTKYWECIFYKTIPFMHKMYGADYWREYHNIPEFLWVDSPQDLKSKIEFLENNEEEYKKLWVEIEKTLKPEMLTFKYYNDAFKETVEKYCKIKW